MAGGFRKKNILFLALSSNNTKWSESLILIKVPNEMYQIHHKLPCL